MRESGYYPMGAEHDKNAPYNQQEQEPIAVNVEYSLVLRKKTEVSTADYDKDEWEECERDDEGNLVRYGDTEISYDSVDFVSEYNNQHYTPCELIGLLAEEMKRKLDKGEGTKKERANWQLVLDECADWTEDDEEVDVL